MKAYQLKILVKKSKPPVWWRVIIPAGITFSTLAFLLDEITQNERSDKFLFEFYRKLHLFEACNEKPLKPTKFDCDAREASDTFIDDYFDVEEWFSYIQSENRFRVEIERCESDYPLTFPFLVKTTASNGAEVFEALSSKYYVTKGEPAFVKYRDIFAKKDGKHHLSASQSPRSNPDNISKCSNSILDDMVDLLRFKIGYDEYKKSDRIDSFSTDYYLSKMGKDYLLESASVFGLAVKPAESRKSIAKKIRAFLLNPVNFKGMLLTLTNDEMALFDSIIDNPCIELSEKEVDYENAFLCNVVFTIQTGKSFIPLEIAALYKDLNCPKLQNKRRQAQWILNITDTILVWYYGYMPLKKFCRVCRRKADPSITPEDAAAVLNDIPQYAKDFQIIDGNIVSSLCDDEKTYRAIKSFHADKPYYIIREDEIEEILQYGYPYREPHYSWLRNWLKMHCKTADNEELIRRLHTYIALGHELSDIWFIFEEEGIRFTKKELNELLPIMQDVSNNTRTFYNCGHTPEELFERKNDNIIPFPFGGF